MVEVSVVIPSYNSAQYLPQAIDSVLGQSYCGAFAQTHGGLEVLVVDDGSTDDTPNLMQRYGAPVRYIWQPNSGVAVARNTGIRESQGRYVAFLDADDTWLEDKLEKQLAALEANAERRLCYSAYTAVGQDLSPLYVGRSDRRGTALEDLLLRGNVVGSICSVLCERRLLAEAGGFDPSMSQCADWDMWVRLAALTEFIYLDSELVTYRQHETNMSRNAPLLERDSIRVLGKGFAMPGLGDDLRKYRSRALGRNYMVLAGTYFHAGLYGDFVRCAALAISLDTRQLGHLLGFPVRALKLLSAGTRALIRE
jgi:glycosyltransferase involved in cell wall biosynthesis